MNIAFPPYCPEPLPRQDTDGGLWDMAFDADVSRLEQQDCLAGLPGDRCTRASVTVEQALNLRLTLSDDSRYRNHAWLAWWRACTVAELVDCGHLIATYAPHERPGRAAHARHIRACTTRLQRAVTAQRAA